MGVGSIEIQATSGKFGSRTRLTHVIYLRCSPSIARRRGRKEATTMQMGFVSCHGVATIILERRRLMIIRD